jgi:hypothetical protein
MERYESLHHTKWECKDHLVPKIRHRNWYDCCAAYLRAFLIRFPQLGGTQREKPPLQWELLLFIPQRTRLYAG